MRKLLAVSLLLALLVVPSAEAKNPDKDIVIIYTNDVHCGVEDFIGYAGLALYRNEMRKVTPYVTLVDAGDFSQGATIGTISEGRYIVEIMNAIGYDVAVPGNHEFNFGWRQFEVFSRDLSCGFIDCNLKSVADDKLLFPPYKIFTYGDVRVAYVGATTPETFAKTTPYIFKDKDGNLLYTFDGDTKGEKLCADIQKAADDARAQGADYVIVVGHLGEYDDVTEVWSSPFIAAHTRNIDAFIDGHSHEITPELKIKNADGKEVIITQSGTKLKYIGQVTIDTKGHVSSKLIDSSGGKDEEIDILIQKIKGRFENTMNQIYGYTSFDLRAMDDEGTWLVRDGETNLCNLVTDAFLNAASETKTGKADIAFLNGGGLRTDIKAGEIAYKDILSEMPFGNTVCIIEVPGQSILDDLEVSGRLAPQRNGGLLHPAGLTYTIDSRIPTPVVLDDQNMVKSITGERRIKDVMVNGEPLDPEKLYKVIGTSYVLLQNGDGHMFNGAKVIEPDFSTDADVLAHYIKKLGVIPEAYENLGGQGRITFIE